MSSLAFKCYYGRQSINDMGSGKIEWYCNPYVV